MYQDALTDEQIRAYRHNGKTSNPERLRDGRGLMLVISARGCGKSWICRIQKNGKRRDIGLGSYPQISLEKARVFAAVVREGVHEIGLPERMSRVFRREEDGISSPHFATVWAEYIEIRKQGWKGEASITDWQGTYTNYLEKPFRKLMVHRIGSKNIVNILRPIWHTKPETAKKILSRIKQVLSYAVEMGYCTTVPDAGKTLGKPRRKKEHRKALPVNQAPILYRWLDAQDSPQAKALQLIMLTACRDMEVRGADWSELDLPKYTFTLSADRMKADREHTVYLSREALMLLRMLKPQAKGPIWNGLNHMMFSRLRNKAVKEASIDHFDIHGIRATFAEWTQIEGFNDLASKACIAHQTHVGASQAYFRGEGLVPERIKIMSAWGRYLSGRNS